MYMFFLIIYVFVTISLVLLIMLQHGKGIDMSGSSFNVRNLLEGVGTNTISGDFITRLTAILGMLFFFLSLLLGNISNKHNRKFDVNSHVALEKKLHSSTVVQDTVKDLPKL